MACEMLHPAGAVGFALWPRLLLPVPLPRRSFTGSREHPCRVPCTDQFRRKLPLSAAQSYRSRGLTSCTSSGSSAELAALSRLAEVSSARSDQSSRRCLDSVPDVLTVISGYWTGPDVDDGCGSVEAVLQRIV